MAFNVLYRFSYINHHTNVNLDKRVVCIVLKGMGENLRKIAMHILNELVTLPSAGLI